VSLDRYRQSLTLLNPRSNEIEWFPKWLGAYAGDRQQKGESPQGTIFPSSGIW
jgi:hypothetical protein